MFKWGSNLPPAGFLLAGILLAAVLLRLPGAFSALWHDELWTLEITTRLGSALEVLTRVHHSNNHHLNTLYLYCLGDRLPWAVYRMPSLFAGVASVFLAWKIGGRWGLGESRVAAFLMAFSYLMIHFSSEARGYASLVLFSFTGFLGTCAVLDGKRWQGTVAIGLSSVLGLTSQLLYVHTLFGLAAWLGVELWSRRSSLREFIGEMAQVFALPALTLLVLYIVDIRHLVVGGGAPYSLAGRLLEVISLAAGGPARGLGAAVAAVIFSLLLLNGLISMRVRGRREWIFFVVVAFASPILVLTFTNSSVLPVRWFLLGIAFAYLVLAHSLVGLWQRGGSARAVVVLVLVLFCGANLVHTSALVRNGRGAYREALLFMDAATSGPRLEVASDHHFRNRKLLNYYRRYLPAPERLHYVIPGNRDPRPEWFIRHRYGGPIQAPGTIRDPTGAYKLVKTYPSAPLSGFHWFIYRRVE